MNISLFKKSSSSCPINGDCINFFGSLIISFRSFLAIRELAFRNTRKFRQVEFQQIQTE